MAELFTITGDTFFAPLTTQSRTIYVDCIKIIYESYRSELSYGISRDVLIAKLTDYFDALNVSEILLEDDTEVLRDSRAKASRFLRKLKDYGWVKDEIDNNQTVKIIMPTHAVTMVQTLIAIESGREMEYQSEISAIYSLLTNEQILDRPYPLVLAPVYERTKALFTGLKQLNTSIRKYIDAITAEKTSEEILQEFFQYNEEIGSKAYHRITTSDNISRFRNTILSRLQQMLSNRDIMERIIHGYMNVENEDVYDIAEEQVQFIIRDIIDHFHSYDEIVRDIDKKHTKYIRNSVERARFLLLSSNNVEGKISSMLQLMAEELNRDETMNLQEDVSEDLCGLFNIFPQGFLSNESLKPIAISRKITELDDIFQPLAITDEERELRKQRVYEKNKNRFSRKNINAYVSELLKNRSLVNASELPVETRRDAIRIIFISMYGKTGKPEYVVVPTGEVITVHGFRFENFVIKRRK